MGTTSKRIQTGTCFNATREEIPKLHVICTDLLPNILNGVETAELIKFRVVSKSWKNCIDWILMKRRDHKLIFEFSGTVKENEGKNSFVLRSKKDGSGKKEKKSQENEKRKIEVNVKDLSLFLSLFPAASSPFPCQRYGFVGGKFDHEDVLTFFLKSGYAGRIKELTLDWDEEDNFWEDCREEFPENWTVDQTLVELILCNKLTRLESLEIHGYFHDLESGFEINPGAVEPNSKSAPNLNPNDSPKNCPLPSLNILSIKSYNDKKTRQIIQTVLYASPNLCKILLPENVCPREIFPFFTPSEIELFSISGFRLDLFSSSFSIEMLELADKLCTFGLENLDLKMMSSPKNRGIVQRTLNSIQNLLLKSRKSLKRIKMSLASFIFMMNASFPEFHPEFQNVKLLYFIPSDQSILEIFPPEYFPLKNQDIKSSLSLAKVFPCLKTVVLPFVMPFMEHCFPFTGEKLETVKIVDIASLDRNQNPYAKNVLKMFPNIERLRLWNIFDFPAIAECIWAMKRLKHLDLLIHISTDITQHMFPNLDVAFTGFSHETVDLILEGNFQAVDQLDITMEMKENSSILDLTDLRTLALHFRFRLGDVNSYNFITRVTTDFSFKWMQQVQIKIKIEPPNNCGYWDENSFAASSLDNVTLTLD